MIIQGSNEPILLTFSENVTDANKISVLLYKGDTELKHWEMGDLVIEGNTAKAPLTEEQTMAFPCGIANIEVKWQDKEGNNKFARTITTHIEFRKDKTRMGE